MILLSETQLSTTARPIGPQLGQAGRILRSRWNRAFWGPRRLDRHTSHSWFCPIQASGGIGQVPDHRRILAVEVWMLWRSIRELYRHDRSARLRPRMEAERRFQKAFRRRGGIDLPSASPPPGACPAQPVRPRTPGLHNAMLRDHLPAFVGDKGGGRRGHAPGGRTGMLRHIRYVKGPVTSARSGGSLPRPARAASRRKRRRPRMAQRVRDG